MEINFVEKYNFWVGNYYYRSTLEASVMMLLDLHSIRSYVSDEYKVFINEMMLTVFEYMQVCISLEDAEYLKESLFNQLKNRIYDLDFQR